MRIRPKDIKLLYCETPIENSLYFHNVPSLRVMCPGTFFKGRGSGEANKIRKSFGRIPGIGTAKGSDGSDVVDTLVISGGKYINMDQMNSMLESGNPPSSVVYAAEGGMNAGATKIVRNQNPNTKRNRALRAFAMSARGSDPQTTTLWYAKYVKKQRRSRKKTNILLGLYKSDGTWEEREDDVTKCKYNITVLTRLEVQLPYRVNEIPLPPATSDTERADGGGDGSDE